MEKQGQLFCVFSHVFCAVKIRKKTYFYSECSYFSKEIIEVWMGILEEIDIERTWAWKNKGSADRNNYFCSTLNKQKKIKVHI